MFAVPFAAFKVKPNPDDRSTMALVLDETQKQLEGSVGFDEEHWPNFANEKFQPELSKRYGVNYDRDGDFTDLNYVTAIKWISPENEHAGKEVLKNILERKAKRY